MIWQDVVLASATVVFFVALLPSMLDRKTQISRRTSVPTAGAVWVQGLTFASLGLGWTAFGTFCIAAAWTHLALFRPMR